MTVTWLPSVEIEGRLASGPLRRGAQLTDDGRRKLGEPKRQRSQQTKAAGQHHVAVRNGEVRSKPRPLELTSARSGQRQGRGRTSDRTQLQRTVAHVIEHGLVRQRAGGEPVEVSFQLLQSELASVVLEEAGDPPSVEERGNRVKVAKVDDHHVLQLPDPGVVKSAQDGRRTGIHQEERLRPGPGPGDRSHARHARRDLAGEKAGTRKPGAPLDLFTQTAETKTTAAAAGRRGAEY